MSKAHRNRPPPEHRGDPPHHHHDPDYAQRLDRIEHALQQILEQGKVIITMISKETRDVIAKLDAATTAIGNRLDTALSQIKEGMTADEVKEVQGLIAADADRLQAMGTDPTNPVPTP